MKVYCMFSLESPQQGDFNEYTQYTISQKENHLKTSQICNYGICSKGPKYEFETAVVKEPSVFEPLKSHCTFFRCSNFLFFIFASHLIRKETSFLPYEQILSFQGRVHCGTASLSKKANRKSWKLFPFVKWQKNNICIPDHLELEPISYAN